MSSSKTSRIFALLLGAAVGGATLTAPMAFADDVVVSVSAGSQTQRRTVDVAAVARREAEANARAAAEQVAEERRRRAAARVDAEASRRGSPDRHRGGC